MKHNVGELEGALLDAAVAKATSDNWRTFGKYRADMDHAPYSSEWWAGGPIIEREKIGVFHDILASFTGSDPWLAGFKITAEDGYVYNEDTRDSATISMDFGSRGKTALIAAMRAYVASKFGEEVELP